MYRFVLLSIVLWPAVVRGQAPVAPERAAFGHASGAFLALSVAEIEASTKWYSERLGLRITMQSSRTDPVKVAVLEGGGLIVELVERVGSTRRADGDPTGMQGFFKAGLIVEDLEAALSELRSRGVEIAYGPYPASTTQRSNAIIRDNSGNLIQLFGR